MWRCAKIRSRPPARALSAPTISLASGPVMVRSKLGENTPAMPAILALRRRAAADAAARGGNPTADQGYPHQEVEDLGVLQREHKIPDDETNKAYLTGPRKHAQLLGPVKARQPPRPHERRPQQHTEGDEPGHPQFCPDFDKRIVCRPTSALSVDGFVSCSKVADPDAKDRMRQDEA